MRILIDARRPASLKSTLAAAGHDAVHVVDVGLRDAEDAAIREHAVREAPVIFTKDEDFAARRLRSSNRPTIVWIPAGNSSRTALMRRLAPPIPTIEALVQSGDSVVEVR